jgi:hypothetical protein
LLFLFFGRQRTAKVFANNPLKPVSAMQTVAVTSADCNDFVAKLPSQLLCSLTYLGNPP